MFNPPQPPSPRFSIAAIVLALFVCAAGAGIAYLFTAEKTPSWLSFLIPSSIYTPSEQEQKTASQSETSRMNGTEGTVSPAESKTGETATSAVPGGKVARPPSSVTTAKPEMEERDTSSAAQSGEGTTPPFPGDSEGSPHPVVTYGKGKPVSPNGTMVRGQIPDGQSTPGIASPAPSQTAQQPASSSPQDNQVVPFTVLEDMARFLANNFWPAGTHPMARDRAITTATLKWANVKYGGQLQGFGVSGNTVEKRRQVLDYVFTPAMINTLYNMYAHRFFDTFDKEARAQLKGADKKTLDNAQLGDMYDVYAVASQGLVETIYAYIYTPNIRDLVSEYATAATEAAEAYKVFAVNMQSGNGANAEIARRYQSAILDRDQKRGALTAALQQNGAPKNMDADSLAYVAQWLFRRGENSNDSLAALANVVHSCALTFRSIGTQYDDLAASQGLR